MPNVVAIARGNTALQLALTGVHVENVATVDEAQEILDQTLNGGDAKVLVLQEDLREEFSEWYREVLSRHKGMPLVVNCPAFDDDESDADAYISAVLKPAIGYEIRLD